MRLTIVVDSLAGGGAERVAALLASHWARQSHEVTVVTFSDGNENRYEVDSGVRILPLGVSRVSQGFGEALRNNIRKLRRLRETIVAADPDCVVSLGEKANILVLASLSAGARRPVVISERIDPREYNPGAAWELLRRVFYPRAEVLVVQTKSLLGWAAKIMGHRPVAVIPNAAMARDGRRVAPEIALPEGPFVVAMGRLTRQKGFDLLLRAFSKAGLDEWSVVILGEGEARAELGALTRELGLEGRVCLPGAVRRPEAVLARASMFVLSSRFEGFPNALLEAMAAGLPVISTNCRSGPADIIRHGYNGLLCRTGDVNALSAAIRQLATDRETRRRLASTAVRVTADFSPARCFGLWTDAVNSARRHV